jgi:hypothetical protein
VSSITHPYLNQENRSTIGQYPLGSQIYGRKTTFLHLHVQIIDAPQETSDAGSKCAETSAGLISSALELEIPAHEIILKADKLCGGTREARFLKLDGPHPRNIYSEYYTCEALVPKVISRSHQSHACQ